MTDESMNVAVALEMHYSAFIEALPGVAHLLKADAPRFTIVASTPKLLQLTGMKKEAVLGKALFDVFPSNPADPNDTGEHNLRASLLYVLLHKQSHQLPIQRYDFIDDKGQFLERYWRAENSPILSSTGEVLYILHTSEDITDQVLSEQKEEEHLELQQAYKKLQESEAKYSALFNSMDQGFSVLEVLYDSAGNPIDHIVLETNGMFEKYTGLKGVAGKKASEVIPEMESFWSLQYDTIARSGESKRFVQESIPLGRWFDLYAFKIGDKDSRKVATLFTDITDKKKADEVISQSEQRFRTMVEQAPVAISVNRGEELVFEVVNQKMLQILDRSSEVIGKPLLEVMPEMADQPIMEVLYNILRTGQPVYGNEQLVPTKKGDTWEERYFNFAYTPVIEAGKVVGIMDVATEVTEQVQARKKIEESQQRFYSLANSITQLAWIADETGWIYWYNDRWYEYTGTTLEEMKGWGWEKVHHPDHIDRVVSFVKAAWQKDATWELVFPLRRHDGEYRWFLTRGVPVHNQEGQIIQWIGTNTDIEDQKQAEALLEQRVQQRTMELERRNRELEQFTHVSHHDLQEPLRKIAMYTDMIKAEAVQKLSEASRTMLQKVSDAAFRMSAALRDVLDFASLSKEEQFVVVDLDEVLARVQSDLELLISEKKATITSDALPTIKGIHNQMHQLLYNLINNALKFSRPGVPPRIVITCTVQNNTQRVDNKDLNPAKKYYVITVQDNGIGFCQDHAEKIFDMFQRLHSREAFSGTGIGLALAKKVISNHGGKIWAEGKEDKGATFKILLPTD